MPQSHKVNLTKNYRLFHRKDGDNREVKLKKHKKLLESMKKYGWLPEFPMVCYRNSKGELYIKDGQHRLAIAESLGLTVAWMEASVDFDVAMINQTPKTWDTRDYAERFVARGHDDYSKAIAFADENKLSLGTAFALLSGKTNFSGIRDKFHAGEFRVKDVGWANSVAAVYCPIIKMVPQLSNSRFIEACMAACRVKDFEQARFLRNAERCRDKLVQYSTRDAFLDMMEAIYNFGHSKLLGLKVLAIMAMRERNPAKIKQAAKKANAA